MTATVQSMGRGPRNIKQGYFVFVYSPEKKTWAFFEWYATEQTACQVRDSIKSVYGWESMVINVNEAIGALRKQGILLV